MDRQRQGVAYSRETYLLGNRLGVGTICDLFPVDSCLGFRNCGLYMGIA